MDSENPIGADNQQETNSVQLDPLWVDGLIAVEGDSEVSFNNAAGLSRFTELRRQICLFSEAIELRAKL